MRAELSSLISLLIFAVSPSGCSTAINRQGHYRRTWLTRYGLIWLLLSGAAFSASAQTIPFPDPNCGQDEKFINNWYFGYKAGLDFNQATDSILPTVLTDGRMVAPAGSGVMSDNTGSLLFYSNGDTVWSRNHDIMPNGTGLGGSPFTTDGPLAIKKPTANVPPAGEPVRYLIFTQDARGGAKGLSYSEIVIPNGGQGEVVTKNTPLTQGTTEKMTGVFHKNGCDVWVIVHGWGTATSGKANRGDSFLAFRVTPTGVQEPIISTIGALHLPSVPQSYRGQMKVSPDGRQLAVARFSETTGDSTSTVELFDFDSETGLVSNRRVVDSGAGGYYGVEFSPSRSRLFATVLNPPQLLQFDLNAPTISASKKVVPLNQTTPVNLGSMQAGPDGKIYVARENQPALGFIPEPDAFPDSVGVVVTYADDSVKLEGRRSGLGLPNFNQSSLLRLGLSAQSTACLQISFRAGSPVENPDSYAWTFSRGATVLGTSADQNPVFTFPAPGDYTVTLKVIKGCFCRETQGLINVPGAPTPGSIGSNQELCAGGTPVPLTSTAPAGAGTGQFSYQWQSSPDDTNWTDIGGANAPGFAPGPLNVTTYFRRLVTSGFCAPRTPTASVVIRVIPALVAGSIAANQTVCVGGVVAPLTSTTPATGGNGTFTYQWEASTDNGSTWTVVPNATSETLSPGPLTATTLFRRQVRSGSCGALSNVVTINVVPALSAGSIAADQAICAGTTPAPLTSTAPATGGTFTYQWESSPDNTTWTPIPGATGETYTPGPLATTTYYRRQANSGTACAPAFSNVVTITVTPALNAGLIASDQTLCTGLAAAPLTSSAPASGGTGTFAYQWESSPDNAAWTTIPGATGPEFAPGILLTTTYFRRVVSSGACPASPSNVVTITIVPALTPGSIVADQTLCAGSAVTPLTTTALATGGNGIITYQWESSLDNATWTTIPGATGPEYAPGPMTVTTYFRRQVSSGSACAPRFSNVVTITINPALTAGTIGTTQTLCLGATPTPLTSTAPATGGTFTYQWESSPDNTTWTPIPGATGETYAPGPLTTTTYYRRRVNSAPCAPQYTPSVALVVLPPLTVGSIAADQTICAGTAPSPLTSTGEAGGGTGTFAYQWESSPDNSNWAVIASATNATYAPGPLTATTYFRRRVTSGTGSCSTGVSNSVLIQVQPLVTPTVTLATPPVLCPGTPLTFTPVVSNTGAAPTFQWFVNNIAVASGPTFSSNTLVTGDVVRVEVTPTAGLCSVGPAVASVTVTRTPTPLPTLAIAVQPGGPVCLGSPLTFIIASVTEAGPTPDYQWQVNGSDVPGATGPVFTSTTLREGQIVTLRLRTINSCGQLVTVVSNGVSVRIQPPVDVDAGPDKEILAGTSVTLEGRADGSYPVRWTPAGGLTFQGDSLRPVASPTVTTTYTLSAGNGGCADSDQVTVTVRPPIRIPNAFTPNGDGRDDTWQIEFIEQFPDNTVTVFNRWGNKIFSANNYSRANEWRGDINGQPAPVGTYYYVVVTKGPLGRSYSGSITILY